jgi:class 3 adenylate cyclase/predicted ATPase
MSDVRKWLETIGLGQYADAFETNEIGMDLLGQVDDQMLKDIGVSIGGHRLRIRNAIAKIGSMVTPDANATASTGSAASAERRQVTVMFCDLVGSTALSTKLDPEDLREIISAYHRRCAEVIAKNGGFVARYMGDGVLAYFGYPQAHEDDAERAARGGLALVGGATKLDAASGIALQLRIGIATGLVVVGDLIPDDPVHECGVVGETPNLAARLQALAEPDTVVIDSNTWRLLGKLFEYRVLGPVSIKGFGAAVPVWQVICASAVHSRFEALRTATTPLVGRDEEIDLLMRLWEQVKRGDGAVVLISGEPGIGKSRITQTIAEGISGEPHTRLRYFCSPHHQDSALYPSIAQLERAAGFRRDDTVDQRLNKLEATLALGSNDLSEAVPLMAELLSIPTGDRYPPFNLSPQKRKEKTFYAQLAQVEGLTARQPVLMVWEDMHWSDPTTRESLDLLIERVPRLPILMIITFRPEFTPPWVGRPHVTLLTLSRLPPHKCADMITRVTGGKALPKEIVDQIVDRTDGVPLFLEELTKAVLESGVVAESGDRYEATGPLEPVAIPTSLHASLLARLDRLPPVREVAQIAGALGRQFSHELISAVTLTPQHQLDDALEQLVTAELIFRHGTPPDAEYVFKHALVQDAAYSTLLRGRRRQIHARIAATLEEGFPDIVTTQPALLAQHFTHAEKSVGYWLKAGQQSVARCAMTEAVSQLQKGLELIANLPDGVERQQYELDLRVTLGPALIATKGYSAPEVAAIYARANTLAAGLDRPEYLAAVLEGQWAFHVVRAELKLALSVAEQIEQIGEARKDVAVQFCAHRDHGITRFFLGEFIAARALFEQCYSMGDPPHPVSSSGIAEEPRTTLLARIAMTLAHLGYTDQAWSKLNDVVSAAGRLGHTYTLVVVLYFACLITQAIRSPDRIRPHAKEIIALCNEHAFPLFLGYGTLFQGWSLTAFGQVREGLTVMTEGLAIVRATGAALCSPHALVMIAEGHAKLGEADEALNCLAEAAQIMEATDERYHEAELHRLRGDLLEKAGNETAAEESYLRALTVANRQGARTFELRAATSLARLWRDQGKRAEARDLLAPILPHRLPGIPMGSGLVRRTVPIARTGSNACSRRFPNATVRSRHPFLSIPCKRDGVSLLTCACGRTAWNRACRLCKGSPAKEGTGRFSSSLIVSPSATK